ncbi:hypothetical protein EG329_002550 [Mollisiaceae sp. DMI_Dod_QoI]|nr:hypothetical protein EG329_002550 [Helotiales sp. DMI_Dod_QoI]
MGMEKNLKKTLNKVQLEMVRLNRHLGHPYYQNSTTQALRAQLANLSAAIRCNDNVKQETADNRDPTLRNIQEMNMEQETENALALELSKLQSENANILRAQRVKDKEQKKMKREYQDMKAQLEDGKAEVAAEKSKRFAAEFTAEDFEFIRELDFGEGEERESLQVQIIKEKEEIISRERELLEGLEAKVEKTQADTAIERRWRIAAEAHFEDLEAKFTVSIR